jgi:hypothetical protein
VNKIFICKRKRNFPFCECHIYRYGYNQFISTITLLSPPFLHPFHNRINTLSSLGMLNSDEKHATEVKLRNLRNVLEIHLRILRFDEHLRHQEKGVEGISTRENFRKNSIFLSSIFQRAVESFSCENYHFYELSSCFIYIQSLPFNI